MKFNATIFPISPWLAALFAWICLSIFSSCTKANPEVTANTQGSQGIVNSSEMDSEFDPKSDHPSEKMVPLTSLQRKACEQFFSILDESLDLHLTFNASDRTRLLMNTVDRIVSADFKDSQVKKRVETVLQNVSGKPGHELEDCQAFLDLRHASIWTLGSNEDPMVLILRHLLGLFFYLADEHSDYLTPEQNQSLYAATGFGAGIILNERTDYKIGRGPDHSPKYLVTKGHYSSSDATQPAPSNLPPNTRIWEIQDVGKDSMTMLAVADLSSSEAEARLNRIKSYLPMGKPVPTTLRLVVQIPKKDPQTVDVPLRNYDKTSTWSETLHSKFGDIFHIKLTSFQEGLVTQFLHEWIKLLSRLNSQQKMQGIILDLRGNSGGHLKEAIQIAESILPKGSIVTHAQKKEERSEPVRTRHAPVSLANHIALMVLVDVGSISASEILASALEDNQFALVLGEPTWGKGLGQNLISVPEPIGGSLILATNFYFSPRGISHRKDGLIPTIQIPDPVNQFAKEHSRRGYTLSEKWDRREIAFAIPKPDSLEFDFYPPEKAPFSASAFHTLQDLHRRKEIPPPASCDLTPDDEAFTEETDCLLDWAVAYFNRLPEVMPELRP